MAQTWQMMKFFRSITATFWTGVWVFWKGAIIFLRRPVQIFWHCCVAALLMSSKQPSHMELKEHRRQHMCFSHDPRTSSPAFRDKFFYLWEPHIWFLTRWKQRKRTEKWKCCAAMSGALLRAALCSINRLPMPALRHRVETQSHTHPPHSCEDTVQKCWVTPLLFVHSHHVQCVPLVHEMISCTKTFTEKGIQ